MLLEGPGVQDPCTAPLFGAAQQFLSQNMCQADV